MAKTADLHFRASPREDAEWRKAARAAGYKEFSTWVRATLNKEVDLVVLPPVTYRNERRIKPEFDPFA